MTSEQGATIEIGLIQPGDGAAVGGLFHEDMTRLGVPSKLEEQVRFADRVIEEQQAPAPACLCWVARLRAQPGAADEVVGVILANRNWSTTYAGVGLWIDELFVAPSARRRGIGRALVDAVLDRAEAEGVPGVDIEAYRGNTPASVLYRSMGFRRLARERFFYRVEES